MRGVSTMFARIVLYMIGAAAFLVCLVLLPELAREEATGKPDVFVPYLFLAVSYVISIPFFVALRESLKLLNLIDANKAFSAQSVRALQNIKICSALFSIFVVASVIGAIALVKSLGPGEDVTFMVPIGFIFSFIPGVIAVFVAVLQKLLEDAVALKSENDLIV